MIDAATVREQYERFSRQWDDKALLRDYPDLLRRYLLQPLSNSETAWAYQTLANVLACSEHAAGAVDVYEAFESWLPGRSPRLSATFPCYPVPEDSREPAMGADEIRLNFLSQSVEFATAYGAVGRYSDYVAKFDDALSRLTPTKENIELRVYAVGISLDGSHIAGDFDRAERCLLLMQSIADEEADTKKAARLRERILAWEIELARARNDEARTTAKLHEARDLDGFRHSLAHHLNQSGRYDLALPVLDAKLAAGFGRRRSRTCKTIRNSCTRFRGQIDGGTDSARFGCAP